MMTEYRESIYVRDNESDWRMISIESWGAGEYKMTNFEANGKNVEMYIPYLTFKTLEKAFVIKRFIEKKGYKVDKTIVGYFSYSRQERETENEPELLNSGLMLAFRSMFNSTNYVIDIHDIKTVPDDIYNITGANALLTHAMLKYGASDVVLVAPDKGAAIRNKMHNINSDITMNKIRKDGQVVTELGEVTMEPLENDVLVILDDICDGGRTFANAAKILKKEYPGRKVVLAVTHAILPFGVELLKEKGIDEIICINTCCKEGLHYDNYVESIRLI